MLINELFTNVLIKEWEDANQRTVYQRVLIREWKDILYGTSTSEVSMS